jgi:hypothetical protein
MTVWNYIHSMLSSAIEDLRRKRYNSSDGIPVRPPEVRANAPESD